MIRYSLLAIRSVLTIVLALTIVSCSYGQRIEESNSRFKELEDKIIALTKELKELNQRLNNEQKVSEMLKFELALLRKELLEIRSPSLSPDQSTTERLTRLIQELSNPASDIDKLIFELRKFGKRGPLALMESLKKPDVEYRQRVERVFSGLLSEDAASILLPALKDPLVRTSVARILGNLKDYSVRSELNSYLLGDDEDFVFVVAEALVKLNDKAGIPVLIDFLKKPGSNKRALAFDTLHKITGLTLNYKYYAEQSELIEGVKRWEDWWLKNASTFTFPE
ncbi:MAG: HEAT repeat domain-containing protein [Planctomycetota bacterium]|nr:HEAT repeat domain-containing protein [Planctomycetota bacterium]MDI6788257.1 HEAT repeat domain-containing protein [Planctomycetota bacterium]